MFSVIFTVKYKRALILLFQPSTWVTNSVKIGSHVTLKTDSMTVSFVTSDTNDILQQVVM